MKNKVAILTHWGSLNNYGQQLQAFALIKFLEQFDNEVDLLRYNGELKKTFIYRIRSINHLIYITLKNPANGIKTVKYLLNRDAFSCSNSVKDSRNFKEFQKKYLNYTEKHFLNYNELKAIGDCYDVFITGSDQVWGPYLFGEGRQYYPVIDAYCLKFAGNGKKRVSYAASLGKSKPNDSYERYLLKRISSLDDISVRESAATLYLGEKNIVSKWVPDPTFLLKQEDYIDCLGLEKDISRENDCFYYGLLNESMISCDEILDFLNNKFERYSYTVACYPEKEGDSLPSVEQWIESIRKAKLVLTNSFHGVVFCLIFNTDFFYIPLSYKTSDVDTRITSILDRVGIVNRDVNRIEDLQSKINNAAQINWNIVNANLAEFRQEGISFLKTNNII